MFAESTVPDPPPPPLGGVYLMICTRSFKLVALVNVTVEESVNVKSSESTRRIPFKYTFICVSAVLYARTVPVSSESVNVT